MLRTIASTKLLPSLKKIRWALFSIFNSYRIVREYIPPRSVVVRTHFITPTGGRRKTLRIGLLKVGSRNGNVLLYRKLQPNPTQFYPVFTPWKRRVKALGQQVAPIVPVGPTGTGIDLSHYLGLTLLQLGGLKV